VNYVALLFSTPAAAAYWQASLDYFRINNNLNFPVNPGGGISSARL
jgi:hypothetical protein